MLTTLFLFDPNSPPPDETPMPVADLRAEDDGTSDPIPAAWGIMRSGTPASAVVGYVVDGLYYSTLGPATSAAAALLENFAATPGAVVGLLSGLPTISVPNIVSN